MQTYFKQKNMQMIQIHNIPEEQAMTVQKLSNIQKRSMRKFGYEKIDIKNYNDRSRERGRVGNREGGGQ